MGKEKQTTKIVKAFDMLIKSPDCKDDPSLLWTGDWQIYHITSKKAENTYVGKLHFCGAPEKGHVEICISIEKEYINHKYATNTLKAITEWIFLGTEILIIDAHIESDNVPALKAFTAGGFIYRSKEHGIEHYSIEKPPAAWLGLYIVIGVWAGLLLGIIFATAAISPAIGFAIGILIGVMCGKTMEIQDKKRREKILGRDE